MNTKTEVIELDPSTAAALKARAAERGVSISQLVAELVPVASGDAAIAELDRRAATIDAGEATVPHEEVERWLKTWGTAEFRPWHNR